MKHITKFIFLLSALFIFGCNPNEKPINETKYDQAYDRIIATGVLKVGYVTYPPGLVKDPNTGELSGVFYEAVESIGKSLNLKVVWAEEVAWGTMIEGLNANRYDIIGSPVWANSTRGKVANFSTPLYYSGIGVYTRTNDERFDDDLSKINSANTKISVIDGEMASIIANADFPNAQQLSLPQLSDVSQLMLDVTSGKSDVTFVEPYLANQYLKSNPGTLKNIANEAPIRIFANSLMFGKKEYALKSMLDIAIQEQLNSGEVEKLVEKYTGSKSSFYHVAYPFRSN